jgi:uncharacterized membrane protein YdcZ (DUF606 family)
MSTSPNTPATAQLEVIRSAVKFFRVTSYVTGIALLLVLILWGARRGLGFELWAFGPNGIVSAEPFFDDKSLMPSSGISLTMAILIVHGWLYVAYLFGDFRLWTLLRWSFGRFILIAAGGVVPFLSFFTERRFTKIAHAELADLEAKGI